MDIPSRPTQSMLAYLALHAGVPQRRERLAGLFWPDATESNARSYLRHALWRVRKALAAVGAESDDYLEADNLTIRLRHDWLDTEVLRSAGSPDATVPALLAAVSVYGGELLPGFYDDWVLLEREHYRTLLDERLGWLLDRLRANEDWGRALAWAERWIALGHVPESAYRALMEAHHAQGDLASVAAAYQRCVAALRDEIGVGPSAQTRSTYETLTAGRQRAPSGGGAALRQATVSSIRLMLARWLEDGEAPLDLPGMALVHAAGEAFRPDPAETALLVRSALAHGVDVSYWLGRASSPTIAAAALEVALDRRPGTAVRRRIVEALEGLPGDTAESLLLEFVAQEDVPPVLERAALAAAERAGPEAVSDMLAARYRQGDHAAPLAALVVLADQSEALPAPMGVPGGTLRWGVMRRRWAAREASIRQQAQRAASGGALVLIWGAALPLWNSFRPGYVEAILEVNLLSLFGLALAGATVSLVYGFLQGLLAGGLIGFADALWRGSSRRIARVVLGAVSGLTLALAIIILGAARASEPTAPAWLVVPIGLLYGLSVGAALSLVIPRLGDRHPAGLQWRSMGLASAITVVATIVYVVLLYPGLVAVTLVNRVPLGLMTILSIGMPFIGQRAQSDGLAG